MSVAELQADTRLAVRWIPFPLHPDTPEEGRELADLFAGRDVDVPAMLGRLRAVAGELELPWGDRTRTYNSRRAQELGKWAEKEGRGEAFRAGVYRAYFAEGRNIGSPAELERVARVAGLPAEEARAVLEGRRFSGAVDRDWAAARARGISAVPTHVWRGRVSAGYAPTAALRAFLRGEGE